MTSTEPLDAFFSLQKKVLAGQKPFESGEHVWLGNEGARRASEKRGLPSFGPFKRKLAPESLTYGAIVAFSGDFYESPDELYGEKPAVVPWLYQPNNIGDLLVGVNEELDWINRPQSERGSAYPDHNVAFWWHAKRYVELSLKNTPHFGWHNALKYARWHEEALRQVQLAANAGDTAERSRLFARACYTSGFADHFLTDGFAAGHVRSPAAQIRGWGTEQGFDDKLCGVLLKVIHDQDGHVDDLHGAQTDGKANAGLRVTNARGDDWRTRCDGQLFNVGTRDPAIEQPITAVEESVGEFLDVYNGAQIPTEMFAAARLIPWPHPDEIPLITKFPATIDEAGATRYWKSMKWYLKLPYLSAGVRPRSLST